MLLDILKMVKEETGIKYDTSINEKNLAISRINRAGGEIHNTYDLHTSITEEVFDIQTGAQQLVLPHYVGIIRGCRYFDNRLKIPIEAMNNRYQTGYGNEVWYLKFREKEDSVLQREIYNQSRITFSLPLAEDKDINLTIVGPTDKSSLIRETVLIPYGSLTAQTVNNFKSPLFTLSKDRVTSYNITVKDVEDNVLALFGNTLLTLKHRVLQITDSPYNIVPNTLSGIEVRFKKRYTPMFEDSDTFICGDLYDFAIFNKYMEHRARKIEEALAWSAKCNSLITQIWADLKGGIRERMDFGKSPYFDLPYGQDNINGHRTLS